MSWQAADWMDSLPYDAAAPLPTRVLLKLANVADQGGERAFRFNHQMAAELQVNVRSIRRALRELEEAHLILPGDQALVAHYRTDRRPRVYNLNFKWHLETAPPALGWPGEDDAPPVEPVFDPPAPDPEAELIDWPERNGGTQLSTGQATGGHTGGQLLSDIELMELNNNTHIQALVVNRASEPELIPCPTRPLRPCSPNRLGICVDCGTYRGDTQPGGLQGGDT